MAQLTWKGKQNPLTTFTPHAHTTLGREDSHQLTTREYYSALTDTEHTSIVPASSYTPIPPLSTATWHNRLIYGDTRTLLPLLLKEFTEGIHLIYIDPPFMTGRTFVSGEQVAYKDTWNDRDAYLQWLYEIFILLHALLAEDGSLYVHLDWRAVHYAKIMLDEIFGQSQIGDGSGFKNEIIWHYQSGGRSLRHYARKHDTLLLYTRSDRYCFHGERIGERRGAQKRNNMRKEVGVDGRISWTIRSAGRIYSYCEDSLMTPSDVWSDIQHLHQKDPERIGYATQKPVALLERILLASSEEQQLVLDCFCGSGVTPVVAERLGRRWIACDKSELALAMTKERLLGETRKLPFVVQHLTLRNNQTDFHML